MADAAAEKQICEENEDEEVSSNEVVSREEIQAAIAKAVELRAIHAALLQGINSPASNLIKFPSSSSPASDFPHQFSAQDYPIFTPSYEDVPLSEPKQLQLDNRAYAEPWDDYGLGGVGNGDEASLSNYRKANSSLRNGISPNSINSELHTCPPDDQRSVTGSCTDQITVLRIASPGGDYSKSRRNSLGVRSLSSCNRCKPATITSTETDGASKSGKSSNVIVPLTDSHSLNQLQPKSKGLNLSWLFPKLKKKNKNENSPHRTKSDVSQIVKDIGLVSIEILKKELVQANDSRDAALMEVAEMRSSLGELKEKLEYLETYCEELKKALRQAKQSKDSQVSKMLIDLPRRGKSMDGDGENTIPVSEEVMVEGFLQMVSESRLSVKQFCKILITQVEETDNSLTDNLNHLLQPYKISLNSKHSKAVLYHIEAIINQSLFQDFENVVFQKNGAPKHLDPQQDCHDHFSSFVSLRNLSWNEVLRKGTKYYSDDFSKFCDKKMSCIITSLNWNRPWPEQLLQAFFVAAKCIWLLHLLAFSFDPPLGILRVEENTSFDKCYMEDIFGDRQKSQGSNKVKIMVMPGFYVQDRVLRCKVICKYKSTA
ncbi:PREDICTED: IRK-interacting protein-like [Nicotiana attenuata]|uniref:Irk-interacting protein n=1 Tax=Nicotiana attenuata TaxID=49451 RepID=A0A1J6JGA8_NICAT|nr:PREDICTED: IRK-interacting protein-like [Nicotiana attenuata]OIT08703.1 irk-interacting protein [Nicotiana attenuata]